MSIKETIQARATQLAEAANAGDSDRVSQLYTKDALLMPPGFPQMEGRAAIKDCWQGMIDAGITDIKFTCLEAIEAGDLAVEVSSLSASAPTEGGPRTTMVGKYIVIWNKGDDGNWYLHRDIWNFDA